MTVTNHMMTGALIAVAVHKPEYAIPLAFLSHFIADTIPHYGAGHVPFQDRDSKEHFLLEQVIDTYLALGLLWIVPFLLRDQQTPLITSICMLVAFLPDIVWPYQYIMAQRKGGYPALNWYAKFHKAIQWCERPWGIYVEVVWIFLLVGSLKLLSR